LNPKKGEEKKPQSKYINQLMKANERRTVEQTAAWERMETKDTHREGGDGAKKDSFVTSNYIKQLEI